MKLFNSSNPMMSEKTFDVQSGYHGETMTVNGAVNKTLIFLANLISQQFFTALGNVLNELYLF